MHTQIDRPQSSVSSNTSIGRPVAAVDAGVVTAENQPLTGAGLLKLLPLAFAALLAAARSSIAWTVELTGERAPLGDDGQRLGRDGLCASGLTTPGAAAEAFRIGLPTFERLTSFRTSEKPPPPVFSGSTVLRSGTGDAAREVSGEELGEPMREEERRRTMASMSASRGEGRDSSNFEEEGVDRSGGGGGGALRPSGGGCSGGGGGCAVATGTATAGAKWREVVRGEEVSSLDAASLKAAVPARKARTIFLTDLAHLFGVTPSLTRMAASVSAASVVAAE